MAVHSTHYVASHVIAAPLTGDYRPGRTFVVRASGTIAPLVLEDAEGGEFTITSQASGMVNRGLDRPILCGAIKQRSSDGAIITGSGTPISASAQLVIGFPNWGS